MPDSVTRATDHILDLAALPAERLPQTARRMAEASLFDWLVVTRAAMDEPAARIVREAMLEEGGREVAALAGASRRVPPRAAALANGTIAHALDYDDTHFAHVGHLSVAVMPAALAAGEAAGACAGSVRDAFLLGAEAACRVGVWLGRGHYLRGFHQTATSGAFGATVAAGRLLGLSRQGMRAALGLVSTRAAGLKSQFGTMGKPFNAGAAAANGVEAALLAARGLSSCEDGLGGPQGFYATHADGPADPAAWRDPPPAHFLFEANTYKLHACCHGTHAMIEALGEVLADLDPAAVARVDVRVNPRWLTVCDIKTPRTGLEVKFSFAFLAAMVLAGRATADPRAYADDVCTDPQLARLAGTVAVAGDEAVGDTASVLTLTLADGTTRSATHDVAAPLAPEVLEARLLGKARTVLGIVEADRLRAAVDALPGLSARALGDHVVS